MSVFHTAKEVGEDSQMSSYQSMMEAQKRKQLGDAWSMLILATCDWETFVDSQVD